MVRKTIFIHVRDISFLYYGVDMIDKFHHNIILSNTGREMGLLMENFSKYEREYMDTYGNPFSLYFHLHFPIIYNLGVLIHFSYFEMEFLTTVNVAPSYVTPNV